MTAKAPPKDNLTKYERGPAPIHCQRCGHDWLSRARSDVTVRCPACKTACRMHRPHTGMRAESLVDEHAPPAQVSVPGAAPPAQGSTHEHAAPASTDDDYSDNDYADADYAVTEYAPEYEPASEPGPPVTESRSLRASVYDAIILCVYEGKKQQLTAAQPIVRQAARLVREAQRDIEPSIRHSVTNLPDGRYTLKLWADKTDHRTREVPYEPEYETPAVIAPALADAAVRLRDVARSIRSGMPRQQPAACEWPRCHAMPGYTTRYLMRVTSPALDHPRVLCERHAVIELSVPGATAEVIK